MALNFYQLKFHSPSVSPEFQPLCWAISAAGERSAAAKKIKSVADLENGTIGVSRMTSGSHLMATVLASQRGWSVPGLKFLVKGNFQNLRDGVNDGSADAFLWETFTSKPYHDSGECSRVGDISTPWPCFMIAARQDVVSAKYRQIQQVVFTIQLHAGSDVFFCEGWGGVEGEKCG